MFLDILDQERGGTVRKLSGLVDGIYNDILFNRELPQTYPFESIDQEILSKMELDSECLFQWCSGAESANGFAGLSNRQLS
jgi:hypothetical protein